MPVSRWAKFGYLGFLSLQNVLHALTMRISREEHRAKYFVSSVIIMSETTKLLVSSLVLLHEGLFERAISSIYHDIFDFLRTCVPALLYVVQNNILFFALSHLETSVFQVGFFSLIICVGYLSTETPHNGHFFSSSFAQKYWCCSVGVTDRPFFGGCNCTAAGPLRTI